MRILTTSVFRQTLLNLDLPATGASGKFSSLSSLVLFHSPSPSKTKGSLIPKSYYDVSWSTNFQPGVGNRNTEVVNVSNKQRKSICKKTAQMTGCKLFSKSGVFHITKEDLIELSAYIDH